MALLPSGCNLKLFFQLLATLVALSSVTKFVSADGLNFYGVFNTIWGGNNVQYLNGGEDLALSMDLNTGSGIVSYREYLFGRFTMLMKLPSGNSAGVVTTFYFASYEYGDKHDEIDFEFLGNSSGQPYILHTNIFAQGEGNREQQFYLWFDPTADYHNYTLAWNPKNLLFFVDGVPIRVFKNNNASGVPFPHDQPMKVYSSIWDADSWATQGGRVKTDWSLAPFTANYKDFEVDACYPEYDSSKCQWDSPWTYWYDQELDWTQQGLLDWIKRDMMIYNYCTDNNRFPEGLPKECTLT